MAEDTRGTFTVVPREMGEGKGRVGLIVITYVTFGTKNTTGSVEHKHEDENRSRAQIPFRNIHLEVHRWGVLDSGVCLKYCL